MGQCQQLDVRSLRKKIRLTCVMTEEQQWGVRGIQFPSCVFKSRSILFIGSLSPDQLDCKVSIHP